MRERFAAAFLIVFSVLLLMPFLFGRSKETDSEVRARLAAAQAELAKITASQSKLAADAKKQAAMASRERNAAADAQAETVEAAEAANNKAVLTAIQASNKADQLMRVSQHSDFAAYTTLITTVGGFLTLLAGMLWQGYTQARNHRWENEATEAHRKLELAKIDESIRQSAEFARAANDVNKKILHVGLQAADGSVLKPDVHAG